MSTDILSIDEIGESQASKYATHNTGLRQLEAQLVRVLSRTTGAEPGSPSAGDVYIIPSGATGTNWSGQDGKIGHYYSGAWHFYTAVEGHRLWVNDEDIIVRYDGSSWGGLSLAELGDVDLSSPSAPTDGDILKYDGATGDWYAAGAVPKNVGVKGTLLNHVIDPGFDFWDEGVTRNSVVNGDYGHTLWKVTENGTGGTANMTQEAFTAGQTDVPGNPLYYLKYDVTVAGTGETFHTLQMLLEDVTRLSGGSTVTRIYMRVASGTESVDVQYKQTFAGDTNETTTLISGATVTTTWQAFEGSAAIGSVSGKVIDNDADYVSLVISLPINSTFTLYIAMPGLFEGSIAPEYDRPPLSVTRTLMNRYSYPLPEASGIGSASGIVATGMADSDTLARFAVQNQMRAVPSLIDSGSFQVNNGSTVAVSSFSLDTASTRSVSLINATVTTGTITGNEAVFLQRASDANAYLLLDARF